MSSEHSPGSRLKQAREAQGKSLSEMAKVTRIAMVQLEGIEQDQYERIPAPVYVKGFVKNYASALGLDPVPLLEEVERVLSGDSPEPAPARTSSPVPSPMAEEESEEGFDVVRAPLKPRIQGPATSFMDTCSDLLGEVGARIRSIPLPTDKRIVFIACTLAGVLLLALVIRSCASGTSSDGDAEDPIPVEALEQLLIATPEPILFELPRSSS